MPIALSYGYDAHECRMLTVLSLSMANNAMPNPTTRKRAVIAVVSNMQYIILSIVGLYIPQQSRYSVFNGPTPTGYSK